ncbi:MAG: redoxin family protein [Gammaproteobacteria bacterium]|uniref:TlpA disulfide reductase family protein n=1 Tax=Rhodoferax sp. TaxID=50421 RepID=UPI0017FECEE6|nr:TlpA disulfide reductase family protein [Rhodoferax sp.]MBU3899540.1 redoxin family protein [Gammaproteobacteria bacterium]MBA3059611.1 TlpA family protein disulfide reductase [Rhodoferax sp.]MBU3997091.1 redoxin family protein [Gammaproteobacteria bacterium]MBU4018016.1 redoxin family protein [Gammaproteobacteria bacterium]MBU4080293.1 redoxin family protein [Gammaproteobacteria bacterium]
MLSVNLGPFAVPVTLLLLAVALLAATAVGRWVGRDKPIKIGNVLIDMLWAGVLVARLAFIASWFDLYWAAPWTMLDIRDGGFSPWAGLLGAFAVAIWRGWRHAALRQPLAWGVAAGALVWGGLFGAIELMNNAPLPQVPLATLAGEPAKLAELAGGKPMVVNLWATWCPPCRREMPVLAAAQQQESGVTFVFVNQGEARETIQRYLSIEKIYLANVLLDVGARLGREVGSGSLPTTLFYDAKGRLVDTHLGQLSAASLASKLAKLRLPAPR